MDNNPADRERVRGNDQGQMAEIVRDNVRYHRDLLGLTQAELADRTRRVGRPIPSASIAKIESGLRRVDVDDLAALAEALETEPAILMLRQTARKVEIGLQGLEAARERVISALAEFNRLRLEVAIAADDVEAEKDGSLDARRALPLIEEGPIDLVETYEARHGENDTEDALRDALVSIITRTRRFVDDPDADPYVAAYLRSTLYRGSDNTDWDRARLEKVGTWPDLTI